MSLRQKIILLFGLLSVLPLLALAAFSYWQARSLLKDVAESRLEEEARSVASRLEELESDIHASLREIHRSPGTFTQGQGALGSGEVAVPGSVLAGAVYIGERVEDGSLNLLRGSVPQHRFRCREGFVSHLLRFSETSPEDPEKTSVEAGFWAADLLEPSAIPRGFSIVLVGHEGDPVLFESPCGGEGVEATDEAPSESGETLGYRAGNGRSVAQDLGGEGSSFSVRVEGLGLDVVVASSLEGVLGPLRRLTFIYWIIVLALGAFTALVFSILISRYTRSLSRLAQAAEEIGLGELDPWLPIPAPGELGQLTLAFSRMLERIRRMMDQVNQSGRLAVVGQLSAYLAHEIRNPLSSIKLNQQRILRWLDAGRLPGYVREPIEISLREVERLSSSVTGVLQLSRTSDVPRELVQLRPLLEEAAELLYPRFQRRGVEMALDLDPFADLILARPGQVKSVALNLMVNALDAQPDGGRLVIRTALCRDPHSGGPAVSLHFQDEGPGVPAEIRGRIFEPFFTTKQGGAGIGLAMAKQAVEENGGQIQLSSDLSEVTGAEFVVVFPLAPLEAQLEAREEIRGRVAPFGSARSLTLRRGGDRPKSNPPEVLFTPGGLRAALSSSDPGPEEDR